MAERPEYLIITSPRALQLKAQVKRAAQAAGLTTSSWARLALLRILNEIEKGDADNERDEE